LIRREIKKSGIEFIDLHVETKEEFLDALEDFSPDIILSDYSLPMFDGKEALRLQQEYAPLIPFVLVTGSVNEETAVECMKAGADDYIIKQNLKRLGEAIKGAIEKKNLIAETIKIEQSLRQSEERYRSLFENSAIPIFEEDFSLVKQLFDEIKAQGVTDFRKYFDEHPEDIVKCPSLIRIIDVNSESVRFFNASSKQEILSEMMAGFLDETWPVFKEEIIALAEGKTYFECEIPVATFDFDHKDVLLKLSVRPDSLESLKHVMVSFVDITPRKKAEAALAENEELFRTASEDTPLGVCMMDIDGKFTYVNNAACELWGYERNDLLEMVFLEIIHEDDKKDGFAALGKMISGEIKHMSLELRFVNRNGSIRWTTVSIGIMHSALRRKDYFVSYIHDITERKIAENTIKKSAELYCTLTENMKDVIWVIDPETLRFKYLSPSAKRMTGFTAEEIMSLPINALFTTEYGDKLMNDMRKIINDVLSGKEKAGTYHTQIINQPCKDGSFIWAEITAYAYLNEETGKLELRGSHRDITERTKAEGLLKKSEEKFRQLFENAADPIMLLDDKLHFIDCNEATLRIFGTDNKKKFLSWSPSDLSPEFQPNGKASLDYSIQIVQDAFKNGSQHFEWVHKKINGELFIVDINLTRIALEGHDVLLVHFRDLTDRKRFEEALQKSEEKFRLLAENATDVIWTMDISGRNTYISPSIERLRGYTPEEALSQTPEESLLPESHRKANGYLEQALKQINEHGNLESYNLILQQPCKNGSSVWVDVTVSGIFDKAGNFVSFLGVSRDITDRQNAELALKESQEQYRLLIENQGEGAGIVDLDEFFVFANPAAEQMFGVGPGKLVGHNVMEFIQPDHVEIVLGESAFRKKGKKTTYELGIITADGEKRYILVTATPHYNQEKQLTGTFGIFRDITESKKASELLKEKQFWLTESQRVGRIGSYNFDILNNTWSSSEVLDDIFGLSHDEEKTFGTWLRIIHPEHRSMIEKYFLEEVIGKKQKFVKEYKIKRINDDAVRWVCGNGELSFDESGEPVKMIGTIVDITDRKKVEEDLINAKDKAEENNKLKTAFLNNISHEIRTPMNAIIGFSGFLNEPNLQPEKRNYFTQIICNASNQLLSIITDIINIATIETGQETVKETPFNVNTVLRNLFNQFQLKAEQQGIQLYCETSLPDEKVNLVSDETKIIQILSNLIGNSIKFTKQGHVRFGYERKNTFLEFFIEDTGIGIPQNMHHEIFDRFRQADSTIARQYGGTGLGLSISKAYVELLKGEIWLTSSPGNGSTFYFTLPYEASLKGHEYLNESENNTRLVLHDTKTLLIAEDEEFNFLLLAQILSGYNLELIRVVNGAEAVQSCKSNPEIDMVIMDAKMPVMDGYEATRLIKKLRPDLPVIMQTAYASVADREKAMICGCDGYISKPLVIGQFLELIKKHLNNEVIKSDK
jgi:PAS domain S-box-containing protein